jgi:hypothetical protein
MNYQQQTEETMTKLINESTGNELKKGDIVQDFRGESHVLIGFRAPHKPASTGRVIVKSLDSEDVREYYPSVINAKIVVDV